MRCAPGTFALVDCHCERTRNAIRTFVTQRARVPRDKCNATCARHFPRRVSHFPSCLVFVRALATLLCPFTATAAPYRVQLGEFMAANATRIPATGGCALCGANSVRQVARTPRRGRSAFDNGGRRTERSRRLPCELGAQWLRAFRTRRLPHGRTRYKKMRSTRIVRWP